MFRTTQAFAIGNRVVPAGTVVEADDDLLDGREALFEAIETASAEPGARRSTTRSRKATKKAEPAAEADEAV